MEVMSECMTICLDKNVAFWERLQSVGLPLLLFMGVSMLEWVLVLQQESNNNNDNNNNNKNKTLFIDLKKK